MNALLADAPPRLDFTQFTDVGVNLLRFAQFVVKVRTPAPIRLARLGITHFPRRWLAHLLHRILAEHLWTVRG